MVLHTTSCIVIPFCAINSKLHVIDLDNPPHSGLHNPLQHLHHIDMNVINI